MQQMDLRPIPSFYCCYLLRSKVRHTALYIGSTPNPKRRLDQHNGLVKGGANRTAFRGGIWRPWEMSLIVTGFPSNVAALQFEWAWQNSHLTRKISKQQRISISHTISKWSRKQGKYISRTARLPVTLKDKLGNLHLLLRVPSFARWPLQIRFFRQDVYESWNSWTKDVDEPLRDSIGIVKDFEDHEAADYQTSNAQPRVSAVDVSFEPLKSRLEKSLLLKNVSTLTCSCCSAPVDMKSENVLVCPTERCYAVSHVACLSHAFLPPDSEELVPIRGQCPKCRSELKWIDLVQELAFRTRDEKNLKRLMKPKRRKARVAETQAQTAVGEVSDEEQINAEDVLDEPSLHEVEPWDGSVASNGSDVEDDREEEDEDEDNEGQQIHRSNPDRGGNLSIVIEDSEDSDDWHILD